MVAVESMIRELDRVVLTAAVPSENLVSGDVGTVVHVYADGTAFEIEFKTLDGQAAAVATVRHRRFGFPEKSASASVSLNDRIT